MPPAGPTSVHGGTAPLGSLLTVFTPPPGCSPTYLVTSTKLASQNPPFPTPDTPSNCDPRGWIENVSGYGYQYYSPAICPSGYQVGCSVTKIRSTEGFPEIDTARGESAVWCVPSGMQCTEDVTDFRGGIWGWTRATINPGTFVFTMGPALQIRWVDQDLSLLETHPLTPGPKLAGAATAPSSSARGDGGGGGVTSSVAILTSRRVSQTTVRETSTADSQPLQTVGTSIESSTLSPADSSNGKPLETGGSILNKGETNSSTNSNTVIIALLSVLVSTGLALGAFFLWRRRCSLHLPKISFPVPRFLVASREKSFTKRTSGGSDAPELAVTTRTQPASAIHKTTTVTVEMGPSIGTPPNPAELENMESPQPEQRNQRWSWMSRVGRLLSTSGSGGPARSRGASSSLRRASAQSSSSGTSYESDWKESTSEREGVQGGLRVPNFSQWLSPDGPSRVLTRSSRTTSSTGRRLSRETFGLPRSPGLSPGVSMGGMGRASQETPTHGLAIGTPDVVVNADQTP